MLLLFTKGVNVEDQTGLQGRYRYRRVLILYPVLVFITLIVFHVGSKRWVVVDKKGNVKGTYAEWPKVHKYFNNWRSSSYLNSPFDSLKKSAKKEIMYDRGEIAWIFWWALFFGGPVLYLIWTRDDESEDDLEIEKELRLRVESERRRLREGIRNLEEEVSNRTRKYQETTQRACEEKAKVVQENRELRAKLEFSSHIPKVETSDKKGVLDKDLF